MRGLQTPLLKYLRKWEKGRRTSLTVAPHRAPPRTYTHTLNVQKDQKRAAVSSSPFLPSDMRDTERCVVGDGTSSVYFARN